MPERDVGGLLRLHRAAGRSAMMVASVGGDWDLSHRDAAELDEILRLEVAHLAGPDHDQPRTPSSPAGATMSRVAPFLPLNRSAAAARVDQIAGRCERLAGAPARI